MEKYRNKRPTTRPRPSAYLDSNDAARRPVVLSTSRGCMKLTPEEAHALAGDLVLAANALAAKEEHA